MGVKTLKLRGGGEGRSNKNIMEDLNWGFLALADVNL